MLTFRYLLFSGLLVLSAEGATTVNPRVKCETDVSDCQTRFIQGAKDAGNDVQATCLAGATLETCLKQRETLPECADVQSQIDQLRNVFGLQINQTSCGNADAIACTQGAKDCTQRFSLSQQNATLQCKSANDFITCMGAVKCSPNYVYQLAQAVNHVKKMIISANSNCSFEKE